MPGIGEGLTERELVEGFDQINELVQETAAKYAVLDESILDGGDKTDDLIVEPVFAYDMPGH